MVISSIEDIVLKDWIDANGHLNLAYYVVIFDRATARLYESLEIGDAYRRDTGKTPFAIETHTLYERELFAEERVRVRTWLLEVDGKRLRYFHEMQRLDNQERVAAQELLSIHVDLKTRRSTLFTEAQSARFSAVVDNCNRAPLPRGIGRTLSLKPGSD